MNRNIIISGSILLFVLLLSHKTSYAQFNRELLGFDYSYIGPGDAEDRAGISFNKWEARIALPQRLKKPGAVIFHKLTYANIHVGYDSQMDIPDALKDFTTVGYSLGLSTPLKNDWRLTVILSPNISSNFESSTKFKDIRLFGMSIFTKPINKSKNLILSLGAMYSSTLGVPAPLPFASLMWNPNPQWSISFGFPRMETSYKASDKTTLGTNLVMMGENFTLSKDLKVTTMDNETFQTPIDNIKLSNMAWGLFWRQKITKRWSFNLNSGYTFSRIYEFADGTDKIIDFNLDNNLYIKAGVSFGF
ncbi:MAG: DUF6268 family outer membrane beta-barrel protein [Marinifilaceae bacterium]